VRVNLLFEELDINKDGKISKDEARGQLREDFDRIDTNHDSQIDRDELYKVASAPLSPSKTESRKKDRPAPGSGK
jgi:Ca2+-binding EF-hand superfamily protein